MRIWQGKGGRVLQDGLFMVNLVIIFSFSIVEWESPSLPDPYDVISDVITDINTTPKSYISWSIWIHDIQHS